MTFVIKIAYKLISHDIAKYHVILRNLKKNSSKSRKITSYFLIENSVFSDFLNRRKSSKLIENKVISRKKQMKSFL